MIQDREGLTASMWACHFDQLENLQLLLDYEKKINPSPEAIFQTVDASGAGIVHWAVTRSTNIECFRVGFVLHFEAHALFYANNFIRTQAWVLAK